MQNPLWEKLQEFDLDAGAQFSFSRRLARDNGWTHEFALRVCEEYKKFLYLACTAGHPVTPSDEVDQAWHLHLTYSRSYWEELCAQVLKMPLHHEPTRGGQAEGAKFENWYGRSLDSYRQAFETEPPRDIWPSSEVRFGEAPHFRRVNLKRHFVIRRPKVSKANLKIAPATLLALALAGCSASGSLNPYNWYGQEFLIFFWSLCAIAVLLNFAFRAHQSLPNDELFPAKKFDPYILARLSDAKDLPTDAALCSLQFQGFITTDAVGAISRVAGTGRPAHPFELRVWEQISPSVRLSGVQRVMRGTFGDIDRQLEEAGLILSTHSKEKVQGAVLASTTILLLIGIGKILVGLHRDRPVGFLTLSCLLVFACGLLVMLNAPLHRTQRGERYLEKLRGESPRLQYRDPALPAEMLVMSAALWGYALLEGYGFADFRRMPPQTSSGGDSRSGCGSSGGDGGGSGCGGGGCGGCGGGGD